MTEGVFSSDEVCRAAGISYRMLDLWCRTGVLVPSVHRADGPGSVRRFTAADIYRAALIGRLRNIGVSLEAIRRDGDPRLTVVRLLTELSAPAFHEGDRLPEDPGRVNFSIWERLERRPEAVGG